MKMIYELNDKENLICYAYIKSDAHRKILENDVSTHIGISVVRDKNGRFYNTIILVKF